MHLSFFRDAHALLRKEKMSNSPGYYKGCIELNGFKTPFIVFASSNDHAVQKALKDVGVYLPGAVVHEIEGPYPTVDL